MRVAVSTERGSIKGNTRGPSYNGMTYVVLDDGCGAAFPDDRITPLPDEGEDKDLRPQGLETK